MPSKWGGGREKQMLMLLRLTLEEKMEASESYHWESAAEVPYPALFSPWVWGRELFYQLLSAQRMGLLNSEFLVLWCGSVFTASMHRCACLPSCSDWYVRSRRESRTSHPMGVRHELIHLEMNQSLALF